MQQQRDVHQPTIQRLANRLSQGNHKLKCPICQGDRQKHKSDTPLSILVESDGVKYNCHHCNEKGAWFFDKPSTYTMPITNRYKDMSTSKSSDTTEDVDINDFSVDDISFTNTPTTSRETSNGNGSSGNGKGSGSASTSNLETVTGREYLISRGISPDVIDRHTVSDTYSFRGTRLQAVGFVYPDATKWRSTVGKSFSQTGVCQDLYMLDTHKEGNSVLICEGEIDALTWRSVGLPDDVTVVSVPGGAPAQVKAGRIDPSEDKKFQFLFRAKGVLDSADRIYLNTDNDTAGEALFEEIVRRVGRAKVWRVALPHKDASDTLANTDADTLVRAFHSAAPLPVIGLHTADDFDHDFSDLYEKGGMRGANVGISGVDNLISIPLGMVSIVTGFPGSGKSDFVDQVCVNLARDYGWKTVYCSFEKPPMYHMAQLSQKLTGKAFFEDLPEAPRMTSEERDYSLGWIKENFMFMDASNGGPTDMDGILEAASVAVMRMGCRVLVIDPYNYLSVDKSGLVTDAISEMLTKLRNWAREHDAHVFFIAHPSKPEAKQGKYICGGNDVSHSAAWFAKADLGITLWRSPDNKSEFHCWKCRWSWMGTTGACDIGHNPDNSRWFDSGGQFSNPDEFDWIDETDLDF